MKRIAMLTLVVSLLATSAMAAIDGAWTASIDEKRPERLYFSITRGRSHQNGMTIPSGAFEGLTAAQIGAATMTPVQFQLRREAGVVSYEGTFRSGRGAGQFTFAPERGYIAAVRALGIEFDVGHDGERSDEETLFTLALHDVSTAWIRSMIAEGYRTTLKKYLTMRIFDVSPEYVREMRALGFADLSADDLVSTKIHAVTPEYVRETRAAGWKLALGQLQSSRIHGATPAFAEEMRKAGYGNLSHDDLVSFRIHGVTAAFIDGFRRLGYDGLTADQLVSMRIHRVTPQFVRDMELAGYTKVPVQKLIAMRIHGIDAEFVKRVGQ